MANYTLGSSRQLNSHPPKPTSPDNELSTALDQNIGLLQKKLQEISKDTTLDPKVLKEQTAEIQKQVVAYQDVRKQVGLISQAKLNLLPPNEAAALDKRLSGLADRAASIRPDLQSWQKFSAISNQINQNISNPQATRNRQTEQVQTLKNLEAQAKTSQDMLGFTQQRLKLEQQLNQGGGNGGMAIGLAGGYAVGRAKALYNQASGSYESLNNRFNFDQNLTQSQSQLARSRLNLGAKLTGYNQLKNNAEAAINNSQYAVPAAIAGDAIGIAAPFLPMLKNMAGSGAGKLLGGGALVAGIAQKGTEAVQIVSQIKPILDLHKQLLEDVKSGKLSEADAKKYMAYKQGQQTTGIPFGSEIGGFFAGLGAGGFLDDKRKAELDKQYSSGDQGFTLDKFKNSSGWQLQARQMSNEISDFQYNYNRQNTLLNRGYSRQKEDIAKQQGRTIEDYNIQQSHLSLQQSYTTADTAKSLGRNQQDYDKTLSRENFDYNKARTRNEEDYSHAVERIELGNFRVKRDYAIQAGRLDEDYNRNRVRLEEDSSRSLTRLREDSARDLSRLEEDSARDSQRLAEDSARNLTRLTEDSNRERLRSNQDYARNSLELNRQSSRNLADLNTSFKDSVIGLFAPGLASSKAFQFAKLSRDYQKNKTRLGEDTQFQREGLDLSKKRNDEDIDRAESRGKEDINRNLSRGNEDIGRNLARGREDISRNLGRGEEDISREKNRAEEDAARDKARQSFDLLKQETDALKDSQIALRDTNIQFQRTQADLNTQHERSLTDATTQYTRNLTDIQTQYARATEQNAFEQSQAAKEANRSLDDLSLNLKRAGEDFQTAKADLEHEKANFARDFNLKLDALVPDLTNMGLNLGEINNLLGPFKQKIADINGTPINTNTAGQDLGVKGGGRGYSHALGLDNVPYDEYPARLHKGEMVLTAHGANQYRNYLGGGVNGIPGLNAAGPGATADIGSDPTNFMQKAQDSISLNDFGPNGSNWDLARRMGASRSTGWGRGGSGFNLNPPAGYGGGNSYNIPINITVQGGSQDVKQRVQNVSRQFGAMLQGALNGDGGMY